MKSKWQEWRDFCMYEMQSDPETGKRYGIASWKNSELFIMQINKTFDEAFKKSIRK